MIINQPISDMFRRIGPPAYQELGNSYRHLRSVVAIQAPFDFARPSSIHSSYKVFPPTFKLMLSTTTRSTWTKTSFICAAFSFILAMSKIFWNIPPSDFISRPVNAASKIGHGSPFYNLSKSISLGILAVRRLSAGVAVTDVCAI